MLRLVLTTSSLALLLAGTALASHLDPHKEIRPADQARARSMLLEKRDLGSGFTALPGSGATHTTCKALDESDLTVTGAATSPVWFGKRAWVFSQSSVYRSVSEADVSWRRKVRGISTRCVAEKPQGSKLLSVTKPKLPRIAARTAAFRIVFQTSARGSRAREDVILLQQARGQVLLVLVSQGKTQVVDETRLARALGTRMKTAMRGA